MELVLRRRKGGKVERTCGHQVRFVPGVKERARELWMKKVEYQQRKMMRRRQEEENRSWRDWDEVDIGVKEEADCRDKAKHIRNVSYWQRG